MISISLILCTDNNEDIVDLRLKALKPIVDEVLIIDKGSKDRTLELASIYSKKIYEVKNDNSYSELLGTAINEATSEYILYLRCHEEFFKENLEKLAELKSTSTGKEDCINFSYNLNNDTEGNTLKVSRLIKKEKELKFRRTVFENFFLEGTSLDKEIFINNQSITTVLNQKEQPTKAVRVLIGSPVHQDSEVLSEFLLSLCDLDKTGLEVDYCFVDDNKDDASKELLRNFKNTFKNTTIFDFNIDRSRYYCDDYTHRWDDDLVARVTKFKNKIIDHAKANNYDYLFFIDSDIVLHPKTLKQLISSNKDIISNIFWTKWNPQVEELPQVWLKDSYTLYEANMAVPMTQGEITERTQAFLNMLRKPGVYRVGGLGACTLLSRKSLVSGCNFNKLYNLSFWGEDRYFCIRAVALGFELFVDTHYPAYHIYRKTDLSGVQTFKNNASNRDREILCNNIFDLISEALNKLETFSYKEPQSDTWKKYFTQKAIFREELRIKRDRKNIADTKTIGRLQVLECKFTLYTNENKIGAKMVLALSGYKNNYSYYKEHDGDIILRMDDNGNWLIDEFELEKQRPMANPALLRKVRDNPKLTLSMIVKNEERRYLERALLAHREYIDEAVIIDDGSTDRTVEIVKDILGDKNLTLIENTDSKFSNEIALRKQQWSETIKRNPDWMLILDADEIFEDAFKNEVRTMIENVDVDSYIFRLFDFWDEENYRDDKLWCAHYTYRCFLTRYQKNFVYRWKETAQHCGRMPENILGLPIGKSEMRLKHYGWARLSDRLNKYERYMKLDPDGRFGILEQYKSILDSNPNLVKWAE